MGVLLSHSLERSGETDQGCSIELFKIYRQNIMDVLLNHSLERLGETACFWILYLKVILWIFMCRMYSAKNLRCLIEILEMQNAF
jgi:hypothetical protein